VLISQNHLFTVMRILPGPSFLRRICYAAAVPLALATTCVAVVTSNAVGYVNTSIPPGFSLISNPLCAENSRVAALFGNTADLPDGFSIFFMENGKYLRTTFHPGSRQFEPQEVADRELRPGDGIWVYNPGATTLTVTFVGRLLHGAVTNRASAGFSIVSCAIPRSATPDEMSFPKTPGDIIYFFDSARQQFQISIFDDIENTWLPPLKKLSVGEAFLVYKSAPAEWVQRHSVTGFAGQAATARTGGSSDESFEWSELFAPFPMRSGNVVLFSIELIPGGESLEVAAIAPSGETFFALEFRDGLINNAVPYATNAWNSLQLRADLDTQMFDLHLSGSGLVAGSFPLGPAGSLLVPTISELRLRVLGFPGAAATAWIDNITLTLQASTPLNLLGIDFDQTLPRFTPNNGTLRREVRP
jgi:hypothetical protein